MAQENDPRHMTHSHFIIIARDMITDADTTADTDAAREAPADAGTGTGADAGTGTGAVATYANDTHFIGS